MVRKLFLRLGLRKFVFFASERQSRDQTVKTRRQNEHSQPSPK